MEHIEIKNSLDSKLQTFSICPVTDSQYFGSYRKNKIFKNRKMRNPKLELTADFQQHSPELSNRNDDHGQRDRRLVEPVIVRFRDFRQTLFGELFLSLAYISFCSFLSWVIM